MNKVAQKETEKYLVRTHASSLWEGSANLDDIYSDQLKERAEILELYTYLKNLDLDIQKVQDAPEESWFSKIPYFYVELWNRMGYNDRLIVFHYAIMNI